jgi:hypothetical protein
MTIRRLDELPDVFRLWPEAGKLLGLGRNSTFECARRGEIPTLRFGKRLMVSKAALVRLLTEGQPAARPGDAPAVGAPLPLRRRGVP